MTLRLVLRPDEVLILNGAELQNGPRRRILLVRTKDVKVVRENHIMTPEEGEKSDLHKLAYRLFQYLSGMTSLSHKECWDLSEECMTHFEGDTALRSIQLEFKWFLFYKKILGSLREGG